MSAGNIHKVSSRWMTSPRRGQAHTGGGPVADTAHLPAVRPPAGIPPRRRLTGWLGGLTLCTLIVAAHAAGTAVVYRLNRTPSTGVTFFPADGVTLAALLLVPRRWRPAVLAATYLSELVSHFILHETVATAFGLALSNTVGPAVGAALIRRWVGGVPHLSRRRDLTAFLIGGVVVGPIVEALIGPPFARLTTANSPMTTVMARWWTGDALGVLIIGGLILAWATETSWPVRPRYPVFEANCLLLILTLGTWLIFWQWTPSPVYLVIPAMGWAALRFGTRGATTAGALVTAIAEWATVAGHGQFAEIAAHNPALALWLLQLFLAVVVLAGLVVAAQVADLARAQRAERDARIAASEAKAAERTRLARDLHDSVSQALFSMTMHSRTAQLALAKTGVADDSPAARAVDRLRVLTAGALAEMRALIFELRPGALAEEGLVTALHRQATAISAREGLQITIDGPEQRLNLAPEAEEHCYRLILEAWHNTIKHAAAETIITTVSMDDQTVTIEAVDDGCGFDTTAVPAGHLGLRTMRERAAAIGATLDLTSLVGLGTTVRLHLPQSVTPTTLPTTTPGTAGSSG
jgi:signal transduction histidine kinase